MNFNRGFRPRVPHLGLCSILFIGVLGDHSVVAQVTPNMVRATVQARVGDINKLRVPDDDTDLPQPRLLSGESDPLFAITEEKRFLGQLLFHDPIRSTDLDLSLGGDPAFRLTASCSSCHLSHAGTKAGQVFNFGVGGEGRLTLGLGLDEVLVERTQSPSAADIIPTGIVKIGTAGEVLLDGSADAVDSAPRLSPSLVGAAFNQRLLLDGLAGESDPATNPDALPAIENVIQIASRNHRMFDDQAVEVQLNPVYQQLFAEAFPDEHAQFLISGDPNDYINSDTMQRAIGAFLRSTITRDSPWDRFLAGDDPSLTDQQLRGALLFVSTVADGGADCISCHSGPALNQQLGDEEGTLVEENFFNLGLNEHPLQDFAREVLDDPNYHDLGRQNVTGNSAEAYEFRTLTVRQLKKSGPFMHSCELATLRDVVEYFNAGIPSNPLAVAAGTVTTQFTQPRGLASPPGLGLSPEDVDALVEFLDNGLYDPALVFYDPASPTRTFEPNADDLTYRPDLQILGAVNGFLPSRFAIGNDDPLTREQTIYKRGYVNGDSVADLSDVISLLNFLFADGASPVSMPAGDVNFDLQVNLSDPIYLINFLFRDGPEPPPPFEESAQITF